MNKTFWGNFTVLTTSPLSSLAITADIQDNHPSTPTLCEKYCLGDYFDVNNNRCKLSHTYFLRRPVACWMMNSQPVSQSRPRPSPPTTPLCPAMAAPPPTPPTRESSPSVQTTRSPHASSGDYLSLLSSPNTLVR